MDVMQYAWFAAIVVGVVLSSISKALRQRTLTETGVDHTVINRIHAQVTIAMAVTAGLIGTNQVFAQIQNPFYIYSQNIDNIHVLIGKVILTVFWLVFLAWVWLSDNFSIYVRLMLPNALRRLDFLAKPVATVCVVVGMVALALYPGNRLPVLITNSANQSLEWVQIAPASHFADGDQSAPQDTAVGPKGRRVENVELGSDPKYTLQFKFADKDKPMRASVPFEIGEFSMGLVHIAFDEKMQLRIFDRRVFK